MNNCVKKLFVLGIVILSLGFTSTTLAYVYPGDPPGSNALYSITVRATYIYATNSYDIGQTTGEFHVRVYFVVDGTQSGTYNGPEFAIDAPGTWTGNTVVVSNKIIDSTDLIYVGLGEHDGWIFYDTIINYHSYANPLDRTIQYSITNGNDRCRFTITASYYGPDN